MATQIPINRFKVLTSVLNSGSNTIYEVTENVAAILLSAAVTNVTSSLQTVNVQVQKSGSAGSYYLIYNSPIPVGEALNPFPGKVILEKNDSLVMQTSVSGSLHVVLSVLENATD
jgi:hypothetical protein